MSERWSESQKDEVVRLYEDGLTFERIVEATGMPQSTILYVLRERHAVPRRAGRSTDLDTNMILRRWEASERSVGRLEARVRELEAELARKDALLERYRNKDRLADA